MKKLFLDANIVIDYLNQESKDHESAKTCLQIIRTYYNRPVVSPFTVLITNFLTGKFIKNKQKHRQQMELVFSGFEITPVSESAVSTVFAGSFLDLEDGLQYQCALTANASAIITKNVHDFFPSRLPVIHPHDFVNRFRELFG